MDIWALIITHHPPMIKKQLQKKQNRVKVTFVLPGDHDHGNVSVVGDFNGWNPSANTFGKRSNNTFSTAVDVGQGERHAFRYVTETGEWLNDDDADSFEHTPFGSVNCVLET